MRTLSDRAANKNNKPVSRRRTKQHALKGSLMAPLFIGRSLRLLRITGGAEAGLLG